MKRILPALLLFISFAGNAQLLDKNFWHLFTTIGQSTVYTTLLDSTNNKLYISSSADYTGPYTPNCAKVDLSGLPDLSFLKPDGGVLTIIPDGNGGWYLGGDFFNIGGVPRVHLAQIDAAGNLTSWNPSAQNGSVNVIKKSYNTIYIGGMFNNVGGQIRNKIAAIDATTGAVTNWDPNLSDAVYDLDVSGGVIYTVGLFTTIGVSARQYIGAIDSVTGLATSFAPTVTGGFMNTIKAYGTAVFIGGYFTTVNGSTRNRLASLDKSTGSVNSFNPNPSSGSVEWLETYNNLLYICGGFTNVGGTTRQYIAAMSPSTGVLTSWSASVNGSIRRMAISNNVAYVTGDFTTIGGLSRPYIGAIDLTSGTPTSWNPTVNKRPDAVAANGSVVMLGGTFYSVGGKPINGITCFNLLTGRPLAWGATIPGITDKIVKCGDTLFLSRVGTINGTSRNGFGAVLASTGALLSWNPNAQNMGYNHDLEVSGAQVYLTGSFVSVGGLSTNTYLGAVNRTNGNAIAWSPQPNLTASGVTAYNGKLYVTGPFDSLSGTDRRRFAVYNIPALTLTSWNPGAWGIPSKIKFNNGTGYIIGGVDSFAGQVRKNIASFNPVSNTINSWAPTADNAVMDLCFRNNSIYVGGYFVQINSQPKNYLAELDATTGNDLGWNPAPNSYVNSVEFGNKSLIVGGNFTQVAGEYRFGIAVYRFVTLQTGTLPVAGYCQGGSISVPYSITGIFSTDNIFTLQVSDSSGSFANPVAIGSVATTGSGTITGTLPGNLPLGGNYKVRVVSSSPAMTGVESAQSFQISLQQIPTIQIATDTQVICSGSVIRINTSVTNGGPAPVYQWKVNGINVGTNADTLAIGTLQNGNRVWCVLTSNAACAIPAVLNSDTLTFTVVPSQAPTVQLTSSADSICSGTNVTYTATPVNAYNPSYNWYYNGALVQTNVTTYSNAALQNNDSVWVVVTSYATCNLSSVDTSNVIRMPVVSPPVVPSVSVSSPVSDTVCTGASVVLTVHPVNGGGIPSYQWKKNGANVGTGTASFTVTSLNTNDSVWIILTSNALCANGAVATSNKKVFTVLPNLSPSIAILANQTTFCQNTNVIFTAIDNNTGNNPVRHQWKKNGNPVGTNSSTYSDSALVTGDIISCQLSGVPCANPTVANSNNINITITVPATPNINISTPSVTVCNGASTVFTSSVTGGGTNPSYLWYKNGISTGSAAATFTTASLNTGDIISCILTNHSTCVTKSIDTSNSITMSVVQMVTPVVNVIASKTTICPGETVTFTATPANGGNSPGYLWKKNGVSVGFAGNPYSIGSLLNGDQITVQMISHANCASPQTVTSGAITITYHTPPTPPVITQNGNTLTSNAASSYQWYMNGGSVSGATSQSYNPPVNGTYYVIVTDVNGCFSQPSNGVNFVLSGIEELTPEQINVYPNPASGELNINLGGRQAESVRIYNTDGKLVSETKQPDNYHIDISNLASGVYIAEIRMKEIAVKRRWVKM